MPITDTLKTAADLRLVGFPEAQAAKLAEKFEEAGRAVSEDLKSFISGELDRKLGTLEGRLRSEFREELRKQMVWFFTVLTGLLGLAVAVIKLFPNAH
jgi:hypothetical protein